MEDIVGEIRNELFSVPEEDRTTGFQKFFKEEVKCYGLKTAMVRKIAQKYWKEVKGLEKERIFDLCEDLFSSGYTEEAFIASFWTEKISDRFEDGDDMVQKGYGWLLKDASITHMDEVFGYVMRNRQRMPRTALRYAIERMPKEMRTEAMKKDW